MLLYKKNALEKKANVNKASFSHVIQCLIYSC